MLTYDHTHHNIIFKIRCLEQHRDYSSLLWQSSFYRHFYTPSAWFCISWIIHVKPDFQLSTLRCFTRSITATIIPKLLNKFKLFVYRNDKPIKKTAILCAKWCSYQIKWGLKLQVLGFPLWDFPNRFFFPVCMCHVKLLYFTEPAGWCYQRKQQSTMSLICQLSQQAISTHHNGQKTTEWTLYNANFPLFPLKKPQQRKKNSQTYFLALSHTHTHTRTLHQMTCSHTAQKKPTTCTLKKS